MSQAAVLTVANDSWLPTNAGHDRSDRVLQPKRRPSAQRCPGGANSNPRGGETRDARACVRSRRRVQREDWACCYELARLEPRHRQAPLRSEAGGQGLRVVVVLQDMSQARRRWPRDADGMLSLFGAR